MVPAASAAGPSKTGLSQDPERVEIPTRPDRTTTLEDFRERIGLLPALIITARRTHSFMNRDDSIDLPADAGYAYIYGVEGPARSSSGSDGPSRFLRCQSGRVAGNAGPFALPSQPRRKARGRPLRPSSEYRCVRLGCSGPSISLVGFLDEHSFRHSPRIVRVVLRYWDYRTLSGTEHIGLRGPSEFGYRALLVAMAVQYGRWSELSERNDGTMRHTPGNWRSCIRE